MKLNPKRAFNGSVASPSVRKVWIEISTPLVTLPCEVSSPSVRKVWIEIIGLYSSCVTSQSPSVRKVWIEILFGHLIDLFRSLVTFRKEGVD